MFTGTPRYQPKTKYVVKADFPYEWYWQGKPLRKGYIRGEHIMPQPVGIAPRLRDPSPAARPTCARCGHEYEQFRPPTPSASGDTERNTVRLNPFCGCFVEELEPIPPVRRCACNICRGTTPAGTVHHTIVPPTPAPRTVTAAPAPAHCHPDCPTAGPRTVYCLYCQEYHHVCQHTAVPVPGVQPAEAPAPTTRTRPAQQPQPRCQCLQCVAAAEAEADARHHVHRHLDDRRFENYVSPNVTDETTSVSSVDMGPSDRGVEEVRNGHLIFAIPVELTE